MHLTAKERRFQGLRVTPIQRISMHRPIRLNGSLRNPADDIDQTGKGKLGGKCNVTACNNRGDDVKWWNRPMHAHYCSYCKREISRFDDYLGTDQAVFETSPRTVPGVPAGDADN